jgi:4,5-dihydroxyphthalate decarboxylase
MLLASCAVGPQPAPGSLNMTPSGVEANRRWLELVINYAFQQKVIPRKFTVDELFDGTTRVLGL